MTNAEKFYHAKNKLALYDQETQNLMSDAVDFEDVYNENFTLADMVWLLRDSFKKRITHIKVLDEKGIPENTDPATGFCMISSYLIYSLTGGEKVWELHGTNLHWWLYHKQSRTIFDITHTQFSPEHLRDIYKVGKKVSKLKTDPVFYDILKAKAHTLAHYAGLE